MSRRAVALLAFPFCLFAVILGCDGQMTAHRYAREAETRNGTAIQAPLVDVGGMDAAGAAPAAKQAANAPPAPPAGGDGAKAAAVDRKIIYTARLDIVVKDLGDAEKAVAEKLAAHGGRVAKSDERRDSGARRTATFTLEVPVDKFRGLVAALKELGTPERDATDSQDVTEEFVDLEARLRNLKVEEETLNRLLKEKAGSVTETLAIRAQIVPVREGIERAEGRMKYLSTRAAFSTVTLTLREDAHYTPPTAPTFADRVGKAFGGSWDALRAFGEGVVLFVVAVSVWLPLAIPAALAGVWGLRRLALYLTSEEAPRARRVADVVVVEEPSAPRG